MTIVIVPPYPRRNSPTFANDADSWNSQLPTWTDQVNATAVDVTNKQTAAAASKVAAELAQTNAAAAKSASEAARDISIANASGTVATGSAKDWASKAKDSQVITGQYSALHWASKAAASVSALPAGTINDTLIALDKAWSSSKITQELASSRFIDLIGKVSGYTVLSSDRSKIILCTNTFTLTLTSAATLGSGWFFYAHNVGTGNITIGPNGSETIDSQPNVVLEPDNFFLIVCDGTNFKCVRLNKPQPHYITSSQSWTCPAGVYEVDVELWGAGGGGSGGSTNSQTIGCGGGQGAYCRKRIMLTPGTSKSITIGTGGIGTSTGGNSGGASSFASNMTAGGGTGGASVGIGTHKTSSGGGASGGDLNISGEDGWCVNINGYAGISLGGGPYNSPGSGGPGAPSGTAGQPGQKGLCIIWY